MVEIRECSRNPGVIPLVVDKSKQVSQDGLRHSQLRQHSDQHRLRVHFKDRIPDQVLEECCEYPSLELLHLDIPKNKVQLPERDLR